MVTSLEKQLQVIEAELLLTPKDLKLLKSQMEVKNKLDRAKFELPDVVEVKTTSDEGMAFSNLWRTYRKMTDCLVRTGARILSGPRSVHDGPARHGEAGCSVAGCQ